MQSIQQLAIIGSTASGKTSLGIKMAHKFNAHILSLDSLAIYKEIDIVSAKPTIDQQNNIMHFGLNLLYPNEHFNVTNFISIYHDVYDQCKKDKKNLIIVGGTSFYLKILLKGISPLPSISQQTQKHSSNILKNVKAAHKMLHDIDPAYMNNIEPTDKYRIEKALHIFFETSLTPTDYFQANPPVAAIAEPLPIYEIRWSHDILSHRISMRTEQMLKAGIVDEVCYLEKKYGRSPNAMKSIGIKETLAYLDGIYGKDVLKQKIITNTSRLAKRQTTFNNSQFDNTIKGDLEELQTILLQ